MRHKFILPNVSSNIKLIRSNLTDSDHFKAKCLMAVSSGG